MKRELQKFQNLNGLSRFLVITFSVLLVTMLITMISNSFAAMFINSELQGSPQESYRSALQILLPVALFALPVMWISGLVSFFTFLVWTYRMNKNAGYLSRHKPVQPAWRGVLWLCLPVINIFMWGQVLNVIWNNSEPTCEREGTAKVTPWIGFAAVFFILGLFFGSGFITASMSGLQSQKGIQLSMLVHGVWAFFLMFVVVLTITRSVYKIQKMQIDKLDYLQNLPGVVCRSCGEKLDEDLTSCPVCGTEINSTSDSSA